MTTWTPGTGQTKHVDYLVPTVNAAEAVESAKAAARAEGWVVATVARVRYAPGVDEPAWTVTLVLREREA
jgi:hypothetical protein